MKRIIAYITLAIVALTTLNLNAGAQTGLESKVKFNKSIHDFGDIYVNDGPVSCEYILTNSSDKAVVILNVVSSCGCTNVTWTREPIPAGKTGKVSATFKNEDGPYPFDKSITVYISDFKRPVVLHLRGNVHQKAQPIGERYPLMFGNFGVKDFEFNAGNLSQGESKTVNFVIANNGVTPMKIDFKNVSDGMKLAVFPNPVPAKSSATMECTITASRERWGKNWYYATPVVDGREYKAVGKRPEAEKSDDNIYTTPNTRVGIGKNEIAIYASTKERYFETTEGNKAPDVSFAKSTVSFGKLSAGSKTSLSFSYTNSGKTEAKMYKLDADCSNVTVKELENAPAGKKGNITVELDTKGMPKGENIIILHLYTNAPLRPVITLQVVGEII